LHDATLHSSESNVNIESTRSVHVNADAVSLDGENLVVSGHGGVSLAAFGSRSNISVAEGGISMDSILVEGSSVEQLSTMYGLRLAAEVADVNIRSSNLALRASSTAISALNDLTLMGGSETRLEVDWNKDVKHHGMQSGELNMYASVLDSVTNSTREGSLKFKSKDDIVLSTSARTSYDTVKITTSGDWHMNLMHSLSIQSPSIAMSTRMLHDITMNGHVQMNDIYVEGMEILSSAPQNFKVRSSEDIVVEASAVQITSTRDVNLAGNAIDVSGNQLQLATGWNSDIKTSTIRGNDVLFDGSMITEDGHTGLTLSTVASVGIIGDAVNIAANTISLDSNHSTFITASKFRIHGAVDVKAPGGSLVLDAFQMQGRAISGSGMKTYFTSDVDTVILSNQDISIRGTQISVGGEDISKVSAAKISVFSSSNVTSKTIEINSLLVGDTSIQSTDALAGLSLLSPVDISVDAKTVQMAGGRINVEAQTIKVSGGSSLSVDATSWKSTVALKPSGFVNVDQIQLGSSVIGDLDNRHHLSLQSTSNIVFATEQDETQRLILDTSGSARFNLVGYTDIKAKNIQMNTRWGNDISFATHGGAVKSHKIEMSDSIAAPSSGMTKLHLASSSHVRIEGNSVNAKASNIDIYATKMDISSTGNIGIAGTEGVIFSTTLVDNVLVSKDVISKDYMRAMNLNSAHNLEMKAFADGTSHLAADDILVKANSTVLISTANKIILDSTNGNDIIINPANGAIIEGQHITGNQIESFNMHGQAVNSDTVTIISAVDTQIIADDIQAIAAARITAAGISASIITGYTGNATVNMVGGNLAFGNDAGLNIGGSMLATNGLMHGLQASSASGFYVDASSSIYSMSNTTSITSSKKAHVEAQNVLFATTEWNQPTTIASPDVSLGDVHASGHTFHTESEQSNMRLQSLADVLIKSSSNADVVITGSGNLSVSSTVATVLNSNSIMLNSLWSHDINLMTKGGRMCVSDDCKQGAVVSGNTAHLRSIRAASSSVNIDAETHNVLVQSENMNLLSNDSASVISNGHINVTTGLGGEISIESPNTEAFTPMATESTMHELSYTSAHNIHMKAGGDSAIAFHSEQIIASANATLALLGEAINAYASEGDIALNAVGGSLNLNGIAISGAKIHSNLGTNQASLEIKSPRDIFVSANESANFDAHGDILMMGTDAEWQFSVLNISSLQSVLYKDHESSNFMKVDSPTQVAGLQLAADISTQHSNKSISMDASVLNIHSSSVITDSPDIEVAGNNVGLFGQSIVIHSKHGTNINFETQQLYEDATLVQGSSVDSSVHRSSRTLKVSAPETVESVSMSTHVMASSLNMDSMSTLGVQSAFNRSFSIDTPNGAVAFGAVEMAGTNVDISSSEMHSGTLLGRKSLALLAPGDGQIHMDIQTLEMSNSDSIDFTSGDETDITTNWNESPEILTPGGVLQSMQNVKSQVIQSDDPQQGLKLRSEEDLSTSGQTLNLAAQHISFNAIGSMRLDSDALEIKTASGVNVVPKGASMNVDTNMLSGSKVHMASSKSTASLKSTKTDLSLRSNRNKRMSVSAENIEVIPMGAAKFASPAMKIHARGDSAKFREGKYSGITFGSNARTSNVNFEDNEIQSQSSSLSVVSSRDLIFGNTDSFATAHVEGDSVHATASDLLDIHSTASIDLRTGFNGIVDIDTPSQLLKVGGVDIESHSMTVAGIYSKVDITLDALGNVFVPRIMVNGPAAFLHSNNSVLLNSEMPLSIDNAVRASVAFILNNNQFHTVSDLILDGQGGASILSETVSMQGGSVHMSFNDSISFKGKQIKVTPSFDEDVHAPYLSVENRMSVSVVQKFDDMSDLSFNSPSSITLSSNDNHITAVETNQWIGSFVGDASFESQQMNLKADDILMFASVGASVKIDAFELSDTTVHSNAKNGITAHDSSFVSERMMTLSAGETEIASSTAAIIGGSAVDIQTDWNSDFKVRDQVTFGGNMILSGSMMNAADPKAGLVVTSQSSLVLNADRTVEIQADHTLFQGNKITFAEENIWRQRSDVHIDGSTYIGVRESGGTLYAQCDGVYDSESCQTSMAASNVIEVQSVQGSSTVNMFSGGNSSANILITSSVPNQSARVKLEVENAEAFFARPDGHMFYLGTEDESGSFTELLTLDPAQSLTSTAGDFHVDTITVGPDIFQHNDSFTLRSTAASNSSDGLLRLSSPESRVVLASSHTSKINLVRGLHDNRTIYALGLDEKSFSIQEGENKKFSVLKAGSATLQYADMILKANTHFGDRYPSPESVPFKLQMDHANNYVRLLIDNAEPVNIELATGGTQFNTSLNVTGSLLTGGSMNITGDMTLLSSEDITSTFTSTDGAVKMMMEGQAREIIELSHADGKHAEISHDHAEGKILLFAHETTYNGPHEGAGLTMMTAAPYKVTIHSALIAGNSTNEDTLASVSGTNASLIVEANALGSKESQLVLESPDAAFITLNDGFTGPKFEFRNDGQLTLLSSESVMPLMTVHEFGKVKMSSNLTIGASASIGNDVAVQAACQIVSHDAKANMKVESSISESSLHVQSPGKATLMFGNGTAGFASEFSIESTDQVLKIMEGSVSLLEFNSEQMLLHGDLVQEPRSGTTMLNVSTTSLHAKAMVNIGAVDGGQAGSASQAAVSVNVHSPTQSTLRMLAAEHDFIWSVSTLTDEEHLQLLHNKDTHMSMKKNGDTSFTGNLSLPGLVHIGSRASVASVRVYAGTMEFSNNSPISSASCEHGMYDSTLFGSAVLDPETGRCYHISVVKLGFAAAMAKCEASSAHGGTKAHLATVSGDTEHNFLKSLFIQDQKAFIGLSDVGATNTGFRWVNGEVGPSDVMGRRSAETGSYFTGGALDNTQNEHCVVMNSQGDWDTANCDHDQYFVCEHGFNV